MNVELLIGNEEGTKVYQPAVQEGIDWSTERKNTPGKLVFKVLKDDILDFSEGSPVRMKVDGDNVFFGFVFKQNRSKDQIITVTAYDGFPLRFSTCFWLGCCNLNVYCLSAIITPLFQTELHFEVKTILGILCDFVIFQ